MPYLLQNMTAEDIADVSAIERLCFTMPWPTSAYRRELKTPETNRYIVVRWVSPQLASRLGLREPTEANLTSLEHPELKILEHSNSNGANSHEPGLLARWSALLPWKHTDAHDKQSNGHTHNGSRDIGRSDFAVVGYAGLWLMVDEAHVTTIGVHPSQRGYGAGELLFLGLADIAREMRAHRLTLEVRVSNLSAQALYRKYGLEIAGVRKRYYSDNGEDAYIMWSEPVGSPEYESRISALRKQLVDRMRAAFQGPTPPAHKVDPTKLQ
ncbi:MAG TPA: ribosomal protein S18-alanine N-acetyltransferase [Chloroflexia bacterium]|nr:ribosomal protein S18-alanine N-acetyltransferase [Chloroflexia bacterium]